MLGQAGFALWTYLIFFFEGSNFVVYITLCVELFGKVNAVNNYAWLFLVVPVFNVVNIFLLSGLEVSFPFATTILSMTTFGGFLSLLLLEWHKKHRMR